MIENGLVTEVLDFYHKNPEYTKSGETHDLYGVNIAIGYKELMPYILEVEKSKESDSNSSEISRNLQEILDTCIERVSDK